MMRSMYAGVSGLRNHQMRMDVIGNNIANVNTYGFKKSRLVFQDALYQMLRGGSAPQAERGGTNPQAIGLGVALGSIDLIATPGSTQTTGKNTDLCIDGNGYFIVQGGGETFYTRAGNFDFDKLGNYILPGSGLQVQGWMADRNRPDPKNPAQWSIDTTKDPQNIDLSGYRTLNPVKTENIRFQGNLDSGSLPLKDLDTTATPPVNLGTNLVTGHETRITTKEVYDSLGNMHLLYFQFEKICAGDDLLTADGMAGSTSPINAGGNPGTCWRLRASVDPNCPAPTVSDSKSTDYYLLFNDVGKLTDVGVWDSTAAVPNDNDLTWDDAANGIWNNVFDPSKHTQSLSQSITLNLTAQDEPYSGVTIPQTIDLNFADNDKNPLVYQHQGIQTAWAEFQDGYAKGDLKGVSLDQSGTILGSFSNGITRELGRVALATFQNPAGLMAVGGNLFQISSNSGDPKVRAPGQEDAGVLKPSSLEMSNVDLSEEFTDMIITQRGFQANSRVITTSDEMLQELVNIKR